MRWFLLKQMEQKSKSAVANVTTIGFKSSTLPFILLTIIVPSLVSLAYAEQPLSDAELDAKYIEVKIIPVCTSEKVDEIDSKTKESKISCHDANSFVAVVTNQDAKIDPDKPHSTDSDNPNVLIASVMDNMRLLGGTDILGVPAGVANTGVPLMFGSENYSYAWAGNLSQIFQPTIYELNAPYSVYDTSSLGYGFRSEAHFNQNIPQPTIQAISTRN
jgi:hypothetical protein